MTSRPASIGVTADKLVLEASTGCGSRAKSLLTYDPAANTSTVLRNAGVKGVTQCFR